jgi:hypothetical protein
MAYEGSHHRFSGGHYHQAVKTQASIKGEERPNSRGLLLQANTNRGGWGQRPAVAVAVVFFFFFKQTEKEGGGRY